MGLSALAATALPPHTASMPRPKKGTRRSRINGSKASNKGKLKSAHERKAEKKAAEEGGGGSSKPAAGGGNLMDSLANRLTLRRKGISGDKGEAERKKEAEKKTGGGGMFDSMASMIAQTSEGRPRAGTDASAKSEDWGSDSDSD